MATKNLLDIQVAETTPAIDGIFYKSNILGDLARGLFKGVQKVVATQPITKFVAKVAGGGRTIGEAAKEELLPVSAKKGEQSQREIQRRLEISQYLQKAGVPKDIASKEASNQIAKERGEAFLFAAAGAVDAGGIRSKRTPLSPAEGVSPSPKGGGLKSVGEGIPKELESLAQEARKYKSAEEFIKSKEAINLHKEQLNQLSDFSGKSNATGKALGNTKRAYGDYLYAQDKPMFEAQLTDIWNQATKEASVPKIEPPQAPSSQEATGGRTGETQAVPEGVSLSENIPPTEPPVNPPPVVRGGVVSPELDFTKWTDKSAFSLSRETLERNISRVAGEDAPKVQQFLTEPIKFNETSRITFANELRQDVRQKVNQWKIKIGSEEDALVQRLGEGRITLDEVKTATPKWKQVEEASQYFRTKYDELLDNINAVRTKFNYEPIPKRKDYFRHFQELGFLADNFGILFKMDDLPTELAGITEFFQPGKPFTTTEMKRLGGKFTESAIKGLDNYIDAISKQVFHTDSVQRVRALEKYIRKFSVLQKELGAEGVPVPAALKLPNFISNLNEYGNLLAGKKASLDRGFERYFGRGFYSAMNWVRSRTAANMIGGNISSALTNFIPFTQAAATTSKPSLIRGMIEATIAPFENIPNSVGGLKSAFLTRRFPEKYIKATLGQNVKDTANWLFQAIDKFTAKSIVGGKFHELVGRGIPPEEAIKLADDYGAKVLADRSIGQLPNLMNARAIGVLTQFQTELNNAYSFMVRDIPELAQGSKIKVISALGQFVLYSYLFNNVYEAVAGRRPTIDPLNFLLTVSGVKEGNAGRETAELAGNLPFIGGFTGGRLPVGAGLPNVPALLRGEAKLGSELAKPFLFLVPPTGGLQLKKTLGGLGAFGAGEVRSKSGKTKLFDIKQTGTNFARTLLFGKYATPEAQEYFNKKK